MDISSIKYYRPYAENVRILEYHIPHLFTDEPSLLASRLEPAFPPPPLAWISKVAMANTLLTSFLRSKFI